MRFTFLAFLLGCGCYAFPQAVHPYKMEVTASLAGRDLLPVIFQEIDDNTIFTAAVENRQGTSDTIFVALLDSCGAEKVSRRLVSKYTIRETKTFSVHPTQHGYIIAISSHYQRLLFLDKDLNFERTRNILRFNNPVFVPMGTGLMIYSKDPATNSVSSMALLDSDGKNLLDETFDFEEHLNAATCDENGNIFCVGSYLDGTGSHLFIAKLDMFGKRLFSREYDLDAHFTANEILLNDYEIVVLGTGPNSDFGSLYFDQLEGGFAAQKFYDLGVENIFESNYGSQKLRGGLALHNSGKYLFYSIQAGREIQFYKMSSEVYQNRLFAAGWGLQGVQFKAGKKMEVSGIGLGKGIEYCGVLEEMEVSAKGGYSIKPGEFTRVYFSFSGRWRDPLPAKQAPMTQRVEWQVHNECPSVLKRNLPLQDTVLCATESLRLSSRILEGIPVWNVGDTAKHIITDTSGVYIAVYNKGLCGTIDYQRVRFLDSLGFNLPEDSQICGVDTFDFGLPSDIAYSWLFPDGTRITSPKILPKESGPYVLTVDAPNCPADTIEIGVYEFPEAKASPDGALCKGDTVTIEGDGGETYLWTPADFLNGDRLKSPKAFPPNTQLYRVVVTSKGGCHDTDFVNLKVHPYAVADFTPGSLSIPLSAESIQFTNQSTQANQFVWFVNGEHVSEESSFEFELADTGLFYIKMVSKNEKGCNDSIEQQIRILPISLIHIPNAFSPNGDGINETFAPSTFYFQEYELTIFSRWGQRIWKSRNGDIFPAWDGTMDQSIETVPLGTYQYIIKGVGKDGEKHEYVGKVHVVR